jgi:transmembrane sensor
MGTVTFLGPRRQANDVVRAAAREWVMKIAEDPELEEECATWRRADPAHELAWREASAVWDQACELGQLDRTDWRSEIEAFIVPPRRRFAGWALAAAAIVIAVVGVLPNAGRANVEAKTHVAEIRTLRLADGSHVTLGARSEVQYAPSSRRVVLDHGQAFFEVAHDNGEPFTVIAGDAEIRVTGTKFDVRKMGKDVQVSVLEGRVELRRRGAVPILTSATPERVLTAGLKAELAPDARSFSQVERVEYPPGAWRMGRLYYSEAPLSEIIADIERYSTVPIVIASPKIAQLRVTTSFKVDQIEPFLANLADSLPLIERRDPDGTIMLEARRTAS